MIIMRFFQLFSLCPTLLRACPTPDGAVQNPTNDQRVIKLIPASALYILLFIAITMCAPAAYASQGPVTLGSALDTEAGPAPYTQLTVTYECYGHGTGIAHYPQFRAPGQVTYPRVAFPFKCDLSVTGYTGRGPVPLQPSVVALGSFVMSVDGSITEDHTRKLTEDDELIDRV